MEIEIGLILSSSFFFSHQGEERVFMFPGTPRLLPIYVQNRELVISPMATFNNEIGTSGEIGAESQKKRWQSRFINITLWGIKFPNGENMFGEQKQCGCGCADDINGTCVHVGCLNSVNTPPQIA